MTNCPACQSNKTERARNDAGFFKSPTIKPVRIYQWRCLVCGFVGQYIDGHEKCEPAESLLGARELDVIGGNDDES